MATEDLREHDHSRQGSGGYIDFGQEINDDPNVTQIDGSNVDVTGNLTSVESGSTTVAANGSQDVALSNPTRDSDLFLTAYPDASYDQEFGTPDQGGVSLVGTGVGLVWDSTGSQWIVRINETQGTEVTVEWTVWEA